MQLSVSTSPADTTLAYLLLGGVAPCTTTAAEGAAPFAELFPGLASTPQAGTSLPSGGATVSPEGAALVAPFTELTPTGPAGMAPSPGPAVAVVAEESAPVWVGSTQPQTVSSPASLRHSAEPSVSTAEATDELPAATPGRPATESAGVPNRPGSRPATGARGPKRDPQLPVPTVNPLPVDGLPLVPTLAPVPAPVAVSLAETALTPAPESDSALPAEPDAAPAPSSVAPSVLPLAPAVPDQVPVASPVSSKPTEAPASLAVTSRRPMAGQTPAPTGAAGGAERRVDPFPGSADQASDELDLAKGEGADLSAPVAEPVAPNTFAPSEILSRQFAPSSRSAGTNESSRFLTEPRAFAFASPLSPVTPAPVELSSLTAMADAAAATPAAPAGAGLATTAEVSELAAALLSTSSPEGREVSAGARTEKTAVSRGAKIAATSRYFSAEKNPDQFATDKTFLSASSQVVAKSDSSVGTGVAKAEATMPATFLNQPATAAVHAHAPVPSVALAAADRSADFTSASVLAPEGVDTAHRAVEAVLTAVDRFSAGERHSVYLNFSVGGADLNVRVELRADQVHATFRTDSPELRTALAREWQAVNGSDAGDRTQRVATPVFTANSNSPDSSNLSSFAGGDGSSRQRDPGARQTGGESFEVAAARNRGARSTAPVRSTEAVSSPSRPAAPSGPRRLLAHA
ncbi:MAG: hypothetical protein NTV51_21385 [Verrucomicrobia bacterium]|nr:hypothetical protein [Verrucomicrobiota bacterium]